MKQGEWGRGGDSGEALGEGGKLTIETCDVEFTKDSAGRHIGVEAGQYVMLAVSDTGSGMDDATRARLFEPFFTTKEKGKGTGLGLSIVYGIVKQNGGDILVYSEPGRGTAFKIYLPAVMAAAEAVVRAREGAAEGLATETILLGGDDPQGRSLPPPTLARMGYRVLEAESADEALGIASAHQ